MSTWSASNAIFSSGTRWTPRRWHSPLRADAPGGKNVDWEQTKHLMADRLGEWAQVGRSMNMVIAYNSYNRILNDTAEKTLWLGEAGELAVDSRSLRLQPLPGGGEDLDKTMDLLLPYTAMISIKDGKNYTDKPGFERLLPGDGRSTT